MTEETTQQFLARRKKELLAQISALKGQLAPKEAELAQITKFEAAQTNVATLPLVTLGSLYGSGTALQTPLTSAAIFDRLGPEKTNALAQATDAMARAGSSMSEAISRALGAHTATRYADMTIKQMVVQALLDNFPNGATAAEIREFIHFGYGREIEPSSLTRPDASYSNAAGALIHVYR